MRLKNLACISIGAIKPIRKLSLEQTVEAKHNYIQKY